MDAFELGLGPVGDGVVAGELCRARALLRQGFLGVGLLLLALLNQQ